MSELPPLNALRAFEVVARLGGVRLAANELYVTAPAVSHQLAKLEEFLDSPLFIRTGRSMVLTEIGRDYLTEISPALQAIGRATSIAAQRRERETIIVAAPPSLTANWLLPRLGEFMVKYSQYDIRLLDRMTIDSNDRDVDVAFEYRFEAPPDFATKPVLHNEVVALANPEYAKMHKLDGIEALQGLSLIDTERRLTSWRSILSAYDWIHQQQIISVGYSLHAFEAAAQGLGVAIGNRINADGKIESGELCVPFAFDESLLPPLPRYYMSVHPHKLRWARVIAFTDWLDSIL